ncbi:MAG: type II 3-dehydroquinate dehydratase, partial [Eubacteriales bacterium]|nr:type II 3-dehydroquinate dehydratase [Eubacteriales bacterium]
LLGPNLNMVGIRKKEVYGTKTADEINDTILKFAKDKGVECDIFQSNHEGVLIDKIHDTLDKYDGVVINPGALTHYSYALRDAIECVEQVPFVEVHMSDISKREDFRSISVTAPVCVKQIAGFGVDSYLMAIDYLCEVYNG